MASLLVQEFLNLNILKKFAKAIVQATTHYQDYDLIARLSEELGEPMKGIEISRLQQHERMQERGW